VGVLIDATAQQALLILGAMRNVATAQGAEPLTDADRAALAATHHYLFQATDDLDPLQLPDTIPVVLHAALEDPRLADHATQLLTVMALVDGTIDTGKITVVQSYAGALGITGDYVEQLAELGQRNLQWVVADAQRKNVLSVSGQRLEGSLDDWIHPYARGRADAALASRYRSLGNLDLGTHGRAFFDFYQAYRFAFPGEPDGLIEVFASRHDSTHVLSGYDTSPQGELLVSAFTAGMHPEEPMSGHILPVIISWHLGLQVTKLAGSYTGALDPEKFFVAWERGAEVSTDVFDPSWDFWAATSRPLDELRTDYDVPPLDPKFAASGDFPDWYRPSA
jgi:hypothetical protein